MIFALIVVSQIGKTNLDGTYNTTVGTLKHIDSENLLNTTVIVNDKELVYNFTPLVTHLTRNGTYADDNAASQFLKSLEGKQIKFDTPSHLYEENNVWVVGLTVNDEVIVDAADNIAQSQKENKLLSDVFTVIVVLLGIACCGLLIWCANTSKLQKYPLAEKYAEWFADKQPLSPLGKKQKIFLWSFVLVCFAAVVTFLTIAFTTKDDALSDAMGISTFATMLIFILVIVLQIPLCRKINVKFYSEHFPFDLTDISHMQLPKNIKRQLQENLIAFRKANPDLFTDGGNAYEVNFTADGAELYEIRYDEDPEEQPSANETDFFAGEEGLDIKSKIEERTPAIKLTYEQCNFEAVPVFDKQNRPLIVVIKSRLQKEFSFPDDLVNDLHFVLEQSLVDTLNKYKVHVEGLDQILADKHALMTNKKLQKQYNDKNGIR